MEKLIFSKMRFKSGMKFISINYPTEYPFNKEASHDFDGKAEFIHLFINSKKEFDEYFDNAVSNFEENSLFWISYPKAKGKEKPDINRDILWDLVLATGFHPVSQIALDENWSAVRVKINEKGKVYKRPNKKEA